MTDIPLLSSANITHAPSAADVNAAIPLGVRVGWGAGSLGTVTVLFMQSVFLLFFFTSVLGMQPGFAGTLILVAKLFDLAWGLIVGRVSDRARSGWGRRRPFLVAGAVFSMIGLLLVFCPLVVAPPYQIVTLMMLGLGYGLFNVPYMAMPAEMTDNSAARTRLISWRVIFSTVGTLFTVSLLPLVLRWAGGGRSGFAVLAELGAAVVGTAMLTAFFTTARARFGHRTETTPATQTDWSAIWANRPFLLLMTAKIFQLIAFAVSANILLFFFTAVLGGNSDNVSRWGLIMYSVSMLSVPIWARVAAKYEKRSLYIAANLGYGIVTLSWLLAGHGESFSMIALRAVLIGPCTACLLLMGQSMLPDTIEFDRKRSGVAREGVYAAVYNFVEKGTGAAGPFIVGWILQLVGFQAHPGEGAGQTHEAIHGVYLAMAVVPGSLYLFGIVPLLFYNLTAARLANMTPAAIPSELAS